MEEPLISVIVPIFKVESYLDRCVASIVNQTYRNLEIILVDDGSPDCCPTMCDAWAEKDRRVKVIHKANGGLSDARNTGMAIASGMLMGFVDGDDYIHPDMYHLLFQNMSENQSDISACGVEMVWDDGSPSRMLTKTGCCVMDRQEAMQVVIKETWLKQPVWYKLYKTEQIRDLPFPVGKYHEDVFWTWQAVARAGRISVFDKPCYYYVQRSGSIMGEGYSLRRLDAVEAKQQRLTYLEREFQALKDTARTDLLFTCMYHGQLAQAHLTGKERNQAIKTLIAVVRACPMPAWKKRKKLPMIQQCWLYLAKLSLPTVCRVRGIFGLGK